MIAVVWLDSNGLEYCLEGRGGVEERRWSMKRGQRKIGNKKGRWPNGPLREKKLGWNAKRIQIVVKKIQCMSVLRGLNMLNDI